MASEACYTTELITCKEIEKSVIEIYLPKSSRCYNHGDTNMLIKAMRAMHKNIFNPSKPNPGMAGLLDHGPLSLIKLADFMTALVILADSKIEVKTK